MVQVTRYIQHMPDRPDTSLNKMRNSLPGRAGDPGPRWIREALK